MFLEMNFLDQKLFKLITLKVGGMIIITKLLENWIKSGLITKFKTLQLQFHNSPIGPYDAKEKREKIRESLSRLGYTSKFSYDWGWECWELKS